MKDKNGTHYFEVKDLMTQFVSAFDSIVIGRFEGKTKKSDARVRYVYAPKQRVLHDLVNKAQHITVPVISTHITSIKRDESRVESKIMGHYINTGKSVSYEVPQPVPVNISVSMSVITRYQDDMDQILANFIPYVNPYIIISWKIPNEFAPSTNIELRSEVFWDGNINLEQPVEMGENKKYRNIATTTFEIKGWLFKKHPNKPLANIYEVHSDFYAVNTFQTSLIENLSSDSNVIFTEDVESEEEATEPNINWIIYTLTYEPTTETEIVGGLVIKYSLDNKDVYRFIPEPYTYTGDAFYDNFDGVNIFNLLVRRS